MKISHLDNIFASQRRLPWTIFTTFVGFIDFHIL